jgi:hypothetical protein
MKHLSLIALLVLTGCAYHPVPIVVHGHSGADYTAPDLCAALVKCLNSAETSCFYDQTILVPATGSAEETGCKEVKK